MKDRVEVKSIRCETGRMQIVCASVKAQLDIGSMRVEVGFLYKASWKRKYKLSVKGGGGSSEMSQVDRKVSMMGAKERFHGVYQYSPKVSYFLDLTVKDDANFGSPLSDLFF